MGIHIGELEDQAKFIKNELLKVKDVAKIEIYGVQTPTIDVFDQSFCYGTKWSYDWGYDASFRNPE